MFSYNQRFVHVPSCVFAEPLAVVSAYAILADSESGVEVDGVDCDEGNGLPIIVSPAKLFDQIVDTGWTAKSTYF